LAPTLIAIPKIENIFAGHNKSDRIRIEYQPEERHMKLFDRLLKAEDDHPVLFDIIGLICICALPVIVLFAGVIFNA
jgi:hypothetical protein